MLRVTTIIFILCTLQLKAMQVKPDCHAIWQTLKNLEEHNRIDIISELFQTINSADLQINPNICLRQYYETPTTHDEALAEIFKMGLCDINGIISNDIAEIITSCLLDITYKGRYPLWYSLLHPIRGPLVTEKCNFSKD